MVLRVMTTSRVENRLGKVLGDPRTPPVRVPSVVHPDSALESSPFHPPVKGGWGFGLSQTSPSCRSVSPLLWAPWNAVASSAEAQPPKEGGGLRTMQVIQHTPY